MDDGSKDKTTQVALEYAQKLASKDVLRVLTLKKNRGKGGAVKRVRDIALMNHFAGNDVR